MVIYFTIGVFKSGLLQATLVVQCVVMILFQAAGLRDSMDLTAAGLGIVEQHATKYDESSNSVADQSNCTEDRQVLQLHQVVLLLVPYWKSCWAASEGKTYK